jgi:hypothetical protein
MNAVVFEHVKVTELPEGWRSKLAMPADAHVTVRIEAEAAQATAAFSDDPLFGMWRDREDMADVAGLALQPRRFAKPALRRRC